MPMAVGRPTTELVLSAEEHAQVSALAASRSLPHAIVARAKLVLWAAQGASNFAIAQRLGWSMPTVGKWRRRFVEHRVAGLHDELRPGRPRTYGDEQVAGLINRVLRSKPKNATHWSVRSVAEQTAISKSTVARYFTLFGLQPHRSKSFKPPPIRSSWKKCATWWDFTSIHPTRRWCCAWMKRARFRRWSAPSRCSRWGWDTSKE
jgi:putative transposase